MNKRIIVALVALASIVTAATAQKAQLQLSYGGYTQMDVVDMHDGGGRVNTAWGAITAGGWLQLSSGFSIGASYSFSSTKFTNSPDHNAYYHVILFNTRYTYWRNNMVTLYSHVGIGCEITHVKHYDYKENFGYFAYQTSPIGADVTINNTLTLFGELGYGAQGLVQAGIRLNL